MRDQVAFLSLSRDFALLRMSKNGGGTMTSCGIPHFVIWQSSR